MAITRRVSSGIEITEARGDEDVFPCSPTQGKVRHVWRGVGVHEEAPKIHEGHLLLRANSGEGIALLLTDSFFLHSGDGKLHNHFTSSLKEKSGPLHNLLRRDHRDTNHQSN